jgi:hypothetical protein
MIAAVLAMVLAQVATGSLSGRVTDASGSPVAGIRVALVPVGDSNGGELLSLDQTDEAGRYRLEVPPGRYAMFAGRLDCPTYFPGTKQRTDAKVLSVTAGSTTDGLELVAAVESLYRPSLLIDPPCNASDWPLLMRAFLAGSTRSVGGAKFIFELQNAGDRKVSVEFGQRQANYACADCEFLVTEEGIGSLSGAVGIAFRLDRAKDELGLTCQAKACHVLRVSDEGVSTISVLKQSQTTTISVPSRIAFAVVP